MNLLPMKEILLPGQVPGVMSMILSARQICYWDINAVAKH